MQELIQKINQLKNSEIKQIIDERMKSFEELGNKNSNEIFKELCFSKLFVNIILRFHSLSRGKFSIFVRNHSKSRPPVKRVA